MAEDVDDIEGVDGSKGTVHVEGFPEPAVVVDDEWRVLVANEAGRELLSMGGDAVPETLSEMPVADHQAFTDSLAAVMADDEGDSIDVALTDGTTVELSVGPGDTQRVVMLADVTERREHEYQRRFMEGVLQALPDYAYGLDDEVVPTLANEAFLEFQGIDADTYYNETAGGMAVTSEDFQRSQDLIVEMLKADEPDAETRMCSMSLVSQDGRRVPVENYFTLVLDDDGEFLGTAGIFEDRRDEDRRRENLSVLDRALRHNLRTELVVLQGHAEQIAAATDDETVTNDVESILAACDQLEQLSEKVRRLRDAVNNEDSIVQDLTDAIEETAGDIEAAYPAVEMAVSYDAEPTVAGSPSLSSALRELLENAAKHNEGDQQRVAVRVVDETELPSGLGPADEPAVANSEYLQERVVIQVRDDGPGIPEAEQHALDDHSELTQLSHGEGLGLWTAQWIVNLSGGDLDIDVDDDGTTVSLFLKRPLTVTEN